MSPRLSLIAAAGIAALLIAGSATSASALRNRYTNEPNEGFTALFFGGYDGPFFADDQPRYRRHPRAYRYEHDDNDDGMPEGRPLPPPGAY